MFEIVAGQEAYETEQELKRTRVEPSPSIPGTWESESLVKFQGWIHAQGFRSVELVETIYGWSVRSGSGLENFRLLRSARELPEGGYDSALTWAANWCAQNPRHRYAFVRRSVRA
jgi:hypothetical protein